ncbi:MAG: electron transfer flavoprotein subunit beta/FixA family protein [Armatimonadota bacterium]|nr:electron transfer flavoprotein subunit beta/FixA family protein [Armatimonadota bacterium]MDR7464664.1 electron transfer flavoprotein subunit beta/FixA family protein [Armatimonadota bacterium]MDR7470014.1 electron transfer flavoprotein subunit beta/FixA family protein [Armatimonadota bacterium]MDR7474116.1 electron transfer flavoprotein subunit beta/FixA family protein [Armatimonadota bacterium]
MEIIVCLKQVVDPELPARDFAIDPVTRWQVREGRPLVISTYDENALEVGLQLKDRLGGKVTALTLGPAATSGDAIRLALAMGADQAVVVDDPQAPVRLGAAKARLLAAAVRRLGRFDLVLCGCESADWVERVVGPLLAEALQAACVTFVSRIEQVNGTLLVRRLADEGFHLVEVRPPAVLAVTSDESNRPRLPKVKDIMTARRKPVHTWPVEEVASQAGMEGPLEVEVREVTLPERTARCEFLSGDPGEQAAALAQRLRELKLL